MSEMNVTDGQFNDDAIDMMDAILEVAHGWSCAYSLAVLGLVVESTLKQVPAEVRDRWFAMLQSAFHEGGVN